MPSPQPPRIAVGVDGAPEWMAQAVRTGGGQVVEPAEAEGLVWPSLGDAGRLGDLLDAHRGIHWVQLPQAGVEGFAELFDHDRIWTCAKGAYAQPVAELALSLTLAGLRGVGHYAQARTWGAQRGRSLTGARVTVLGGGGITEALLGLLAPFGCHVTVVRNRVRDMVGADVVVAAEGYLDALAGADVVVLALALTPETRGIISRGELETMGEQAWLVNVARGQHVVTEDLVWALGEGVIAGAALDVTDPEPLPDDHRLWSLGNCIVTPHVAVTAALAQPRLAQRIATNVRRFADGADLVGRIEANLGY